MIELNKPRFDNLHCNVCYSQNDILEITFRGNHSGSGMTVALCADCRNELEGMIELSAGRCVYGGVRMGKIAELLFEILKELKIINKQLSEMTGHQFKAGRRFDL